MGPLQHRGSFHARPAGSSERDTPADTKKQRTVKFINDEASSVHGSLKVASVYTSESGEWKLGGFEVLSNIKDDDAIIYVCLRPLTGREQCRSGLT